VTDLLQLTIFIALLLDPLASSIAARVLASDRPPRDASVIIAGGALIAFAVLAGLALLADPLLDALDISAPAALLAAGLVVMVPALDLLWQTPGNRVRPAPDARAERLALFPYGIPALASPALAVAVIAWAAMEGTGATIGATAIALAAVTAGVFAWRHPPTGRGARVGGAFMGAAMALLALDLVRDGVIAT
jgi:small neutral amino acid transporter SnatA (MarC family)